MATILTAAQVADKLGTDARTARKFLRAITPKEGQPGKGSRWGIEATKVRSMTPKFKKWAADQEAAREAREAEKAALAATEVDEDDLEGHNMLLNEEPTAEELEALEAEVETD